MSEVWANEFKEITPTIASRADLREILIKRIGTEAIAGKVTDGSDRLEKFKKILIMLVEGKTTLQDSIQLIEEQLARNQSPHSMSNQVLSTGWAERLVKTQFSRFYNQGVMELLKERGETRVFVPHSSGEDSDSKCSTLLAGMSHDLDTLYSRLVISYRDGAFTKEPKIPNHPHCSHVVRPA